MQPDALSSCTDAGWEWPGVALYLSLLAPQLAPHNPANVHPGTKVRARVEWRLSFTGPAPAPGQWPRMT